MFYNPMFFGADVVSCGAQSKLDLELFERGGQARTIFRTIFAVDENPSTYAIHCVCVHVPNAMVLSLFL